jgi:hypothetical protein
MGLNPANGRSQEEFSRPTTRVLISISAARLPKKIDDWTFIGSRVTEIKTTCPPEFWKLRATGIKHRERHAYVGGLSR